MRKDLEQTQQETAPATELAGERSASETAIGLSRREFLKVSSGVLILAAWGGNETSASEASTGGPAPIFHPFLPEPLETWVLGTSTFVAGSRGALRIAVRDARDNSALPHAQVHLVAKMPGQATMNLFSGRTNAHGTVDIAFDVPPLPRGNHKLSVEVTSALGVDSITIPIVVTAGQPQLLLTTDKPLYQPGQTIHLRALALERPSQKPIVPGPVLFEVEDSKGNKVLHQEEHTSSFGVAAATFVLGEEINLGSYTIRSTLGEVVQEKRVQVDNYTLPKWKIEATTESTSIAPGEILRGQVQVRYFFGKPVVDADVMIRLSTVEGEAREWAQLTGRTNQQGLWKWEARVPESFQPQMLSAGLAHVRAEIAVTDISEYTQRITQSLPVASSPIMVTVLPESRALAIGLENSVFVLTYYPDGSPASCRFTIKTQGVELNGSTDHAGIGEVRFTPTTHGLQDNPLRYAHRVQYPRGEWERGENPDVPAHLLPVIVTAQDGRGNSATVAREIEAWPASRGLLLRPQRVLARNGETLRVEVFSSTGSQTVYIDLFKEKQMVRTLSLSLREGYGEIEIPLDEDIFGTLQIQAYVLAPSSPSRHDLARTGLLAQDTRIIQVQKGDDLQITVSAGQSTLRPGEVADMRLLVTNERGQPVVAALGIQVVDESVFALQEMRPGEERIYFALAREIVQPRVTHWPARALTPENIFLPERQAHLDIDRQKAARVLFAAARPRIEPSIAINTYPARLERLQAKWREQVIKDATKIGAAVEAYWKKYKRYPPIGKARQMLLAEGLLSPVDFNDPLGNDYQILSLNGLMGMRHFVVRCAGWDGEMETADDIRVTARSGGKARLHYDRNRFRGLGTAARGPAGMAPPAPRAAVPESMAPIRVRQFFPETLWVEPNVITDHEGQASLAIPMADSITTWRLNALASSAQGGVGSATAPLRVFQDFFVDVDLPAGLCQNDEIAIPVSVFNYLPQAQTVQLQIDDPAATTAPWFELTSGQTLETATMQANEVGVVQFPLKARRSGVQKLRVTARGTRLSDAVERSVDVLPDGRPVWQWSHDRLEHHIRKSVVIPQSAIEDAHLLSVRLHPGGLSQVVEGLEKILRLPTGCFEQAASATYPNVLVLQYLKQTRQLKPDLIEKAEEFNNAGYQKVLTFEVPGGGFSLYGRAPASLPLTAYGLLMLTDMRQVRFVDPALIERTQKWLVSQQSDDGSWPGDLRATAHVVWALAVSGYTGAALNSATQYLAATWQTASDAYTLAVVANALVSLSRTSVVTHGAMRALAEMAQVVTLPQAETTSQSTQIAFWSPGQPTSTGARHSQADIETTGLAAYALLRAGDGAASPYTSVAHKALTYLIQRKDAYGTWGTTQATICALRAVLLGAGKSVTPTNGEAVVRCNGQALATFQLTPESSHTLFQVDTKDIQPGNNTIEILWNGKGEAFYSISTRYHLPWSEKPLLSDTFQSLQIEVTYDRTQVETDEMLICRVQISNQSKETAAMVVASLGVAPGLEVQSSDLLALVSTAQTPGKIERFEIRDRELIVYFNDFAADQKVEFSYRLKARFPLRAKTPVSSVYEYYTPQIRGESRPVWLQVRPKRRAS